MTHIYFREMGYFPKYLKGYWILGSPLPGPHYLQMIERKNYGITPICASGKEKYTSGAADLGAAVRRGHGFHTRPHGGCQYEDRTF